MLEKMRQTTLGIDEAEVMSRDGWKHYSIVVHLPSGYKKI